MFETSLLQHLYAQKKKLKLMATLMILMPGNETISNFSKQGDSYFETVKIDQISSLVRISVWIFLASLIILMIEFNFIFLTQFQIKF